MNVKENYQRTALSGQLSPIGVNYDLVITMTK